jgi:DNA-binding XRE family transcriptional regulator
METSFTKTVQTLQKGEIKIMDNNIILKRENRVHLPRYYLIEQRMKLEYSAEEVSRKLCVSRYYYYQLENGRRGIKLSVSMSLAIINALKIDALKFLHFEAEHAEKYRNLNRPK